MCIHVKKKPKELFFSLAYFFKIPEREIGSWIHFKWDIKIYKENYHKHELLLLEVYKGFSSLHFHSYNPNVSKTMILKLFSHESRVEIVIAKFELPSVHTRDTDFVKFAVLAFQSREKKRYLFLCSSDMLIAFSFVIEFLLEMHGLSVEVVRRSHTCSAVSKFKIKGQGIHTAISLLNLRAGASEASEETKHWRGKRLFVNNGLPLQCFVAQNLPTPLFERCVTGKHLWTIIWIAQLKLAFVMLVCIHTGQNTIISMIGNYNDHSKEPFTLA